MNKSEKCKNSQLGRVVIHRGDIEKRVKQSRLNETQEHKAIRVSKSWITKKINGTTNTSKPEEELYKQLLSENESKTIYRNYKCERYPFYCDFYILEDDLFIELNTHWTHGDKPFNPDDPECIEKLAYWKEKAKTSKFYQSAIDTWTIRDVAKQKWAKEHNLNYKVIY